MQDSNTVSDRIANTDERNARNQSANSIPAPVITEVISDSGSKQGPIAENTSTDDPMPLIKGTALPGSLITFYSMGVKIGEGYANEKGEFSIVASTPLPAGGQMLAAFASVGEDRSPVSNIFTFGYIPIVHPIDYNQPVNPQPVLTTPVIEGVYDNREGEKLIENGVTEDATPLLKGSADPFTIIYIVNYIGQPIASTQANSEGKWEVELPAIQRANLYAVAVDPEDPASISYKSEFITFQVEADPITPEPPEETFVAPYAERAIADEYGKVSLSDGDATNDFTPRLQGVAGKNATVIIRLNGEVIAEVQANAQGKWEYISAPLSKPGENVFTFASVDSDGQEQISKQSFTLQLNLSSRIDYAADDVGSDTDYLSSGAYTDDDQPTLHGIGTPNAIVTIYSERGILGSVQINEKGEWSFTPESALEPGIHRFRPVVSHPDVADEIIGTYFELGVTAALPLKPEILYVRDDEGYNSWLSNGSTTDDATPTFTGFVNAPGMEIVVRDNGNVIGYVTVEKYGEWYYTPAPALDTGSHSLTFEIVDSKGNVHATEPYILHIVPPVSTAILYADDDVGDVTDRLTSGARTDDAQPTFHGTGTPNTTVNIYYKNYYYLGSAEINADGKWSFTPNSPLPAGSYDFYVRELDAHQSLQPPSANFTLDIAPPVNYFAPTISSVVDDAGSFRHLSNGEMTDDATPGFSGRGMPNSKIVVRDNHQQLAEIEVDQYGRWTFTPSQALQNGKHSFTFVTVAENGQEYISEAFTLEVITQIPGRIESAEDNAGDVTDPLFSGARTDDTTPTLKGVGSPNGIVKIYAGYIYLGSAKIDNNGEWSFTPESPLAAGSYRFTAQVTGPDGSYLPNSPAFDLIIAPPIEYFAPTISNVYDDAGRHGYLANGGLTDDTTPHFSGRGMPGTTIDVRLNGQKIGEADVNYLGNWSFTPDVALEPGKHHFSFVTVGENGQEFASDAFTLQVISHVAGRITMAEDNVGDVTDPLLSGARTDDTTPTLKGVGTPNGTVEIYDGYYYLGSAKIDANGEWSFTPSSALADRAHSFHATVISPDGTQLAQSPAFNLTIAAPIEYFAPTISNVYDDAGRHGYLANGAFTDDTRPDFRGRGMPNTKIDVRLDGEKIGEASVNHMGNWSFTPSGSLPSGKHNFSFVTVGADGQEYASETFSMDVITHVAGRIDFAEDNVGAATDPLLNGARTDDTTPTLKGAGTPNGTVEIYNGYRYLGSAKINANGEWSFTPDALQDGSYSFRATVISPDGTRLTQSPAFDLIIAKPVDYFAPTVSEVEDNVGRDSYISRGGITDDTTPTFSGHGVRNSTLEVRIDGQTVHTIEINETGRWSWTPSPALQPGKHAFTFVSVDASGNEFVSEEISLEIIAHVAGRIVSADDNVGDVTDPLFSGWTTDDAQPTLKGVGTPGGSVEIFYDGMSMGYAQINDKGEWSYTPKSTLSNGSHEFYVVVTSPDGTTLPAGPTFNLIIDAPVQYFAPVIDGVVDNVSGLTILADGDTTDDATPSFVGKGLADSTIAVYINDQYYGETRVDPWGMWNFTPSPALGKGEYTFSFVTVDDQGTEYRSDAFTLNIEPAIPLRIVSADDDVGAITDTLYYGSTTDDSQPTLRGTGTPGGTIEIFDVQGSMNSLGSVKIQPDGSWSFTPEMPLTNGTHLFAGIATEPNNPELTPTNWFELTIAAPEADRSLDIHSLLQDGDTPLFDEPQIDISTTQPSEPTAFVAASSTLVSEWETTQTID